MRQRIDRAGSARRATALLCVLVGLAPALARAAIFEFAIDPSQSWIQIDTAQSGMRFDVPGPFLGILVGVSPQSGPGIAGGTLPGGFVSDGTRSALSGTIRANVQPTRVGFLTASTLVTIGSFGSFLPGSDAAPATPAPANLAVHIEDPLFGIDGDLVLRSGRFSMFGQDLPITPTATPGRFTFSPGFALTPAWVDGHYASALNGARSSLATTNIQPFSQNDVTATFEQLPGGGLRLTLPYDLTGAPFGLPLIAVPLPANLQVRATGQIVATAVPEAGEAWPALVALLLLARRRGERRRPRARRMERRLVLALALLFLAGAACGPGTDFRVSTSVDTEDEGASTADASVDVGNGTLTDSDTSIASPGATAAAAVDGTVGAQSVSATSTAQVAARPFVPSDPWSYRVSFELSYGGGPLDASYAGSIDGSWSYTIPPGAWEPGSLPVTFVVGAVNGAPSDTHVASASVACDGLAAVALVPNEKTEVPIEPANVFGPGGVSSEGTCTATLEHHGTRTGVATTDLQTFAHLFFPKVRAQSTPTSCADENPAKPYPIATGGCGDGIATACGNDAQCAPGRYCHFTCLAGAEGDACDSDDQCPATVQGEGVCALGRCGPLGAPCNPVAQTGCSLGEKCDNTFGTTPQGVQGGVTRCVADGLVAEGGACTTFSNTPSSSCAAGTTCEAGLCLRWCRSASDCAPGDACDVSKGTGALDPGRDLLEGDGGRCKPLAGCLGCR